MVFFLPVPYLIPNLLPSCSPILPFQWGNRRDNVAGVDATRYLESKGVTVLTNPSEFLSKTYDNATCLYAAQMKGLRVPGNIKHKYPKLVKYADTCGSLGLDFDSVCYTASAVDNRIRVLAEKDKAAEIITQDFIVGAEVSVIVLEMGYEVVALTPLEYVFPSTTPDHEAFLTYENKWEAVDKGLIKYALVQDQPRTAKIQYTAVTAFKALQVKSAAWARVDLRVEKNTGQVYVLEVNPIPVIFYPEGNTFGDDLVVEETFPGGQAALFDVLVATKQIQMKKFATECKTAADIYDDWGSEYDRWIATQKHFEMQEYLARTFDFTGTVLDLACGSGILGRILHENGQASKLSGIDLSVKLTTMPAVMEHYTFPISIGPLQEFVMGAGEYDHIACFGALHFLNEVTFNAVLARMFMLARRSLTFSIDDLSPGYIEAFAKYANGAWSNTNHVERLRRFRMPKTWKKVYEERWPIYLSQHLGYEVFAYAVRFEKL